MDCPNYIAPRHYVDPATDKDYEGTAMCDLIDKPCSVYYSGHDDECPEWQRIQEEMEEDNESVR